MEKQSDRELLEWAARAIGMPPPPKGFEIPEGLPVVFTYEGKPWNPLTDDGDALRLAVKCGMGVRLDVYTDSVCITHFDIDLIEEKTEDDPLAATRRAIVRAAAAIAKAAGEAA